MSRTSYVVLTTALLTGVWYLLSGMFDPLHFGSGVVAALLIALNMVPLRDGKRLLLGRFFLYVPWLIGQIVISNLRVARVVLTPRMPIRPSFLDVSPGVTGARPLTVVGASVTLTPGTLTVEIGEDEMFVHAIDAASAEDIRNGIMARKVATVFAEAPGS